MILLGKDFPPGVHSAETREKNYAIAHGPPRRDSALDVKDFSDFDLDEHALVKKKRPWGWFAAGLTVLFSLTFLLAFALPLSTSHKTLVSAHQELAKKASELDQAFVATKKKLDQTEAERRSLQEKVTKVDDDWKALATRLDVASATMQESLKSLLKAELANVEVTPDVLRLTLQSRTLFAPRGARTNASMGRLLCKVLGDVRSDKSWKTTVVLHFEASEKDGWEDAGEKAAALGKLLTDSCKLDAETLIVGARPSNDEELSQQTSIEIGPGELPRIPVEQAPLEN